jgi:hypothetical protein
MDSTRRSRFSTAIALGTLALACAGAQAANLAEVTVTVPSAKSGPAQFPWSPRIGFDPNTSAATVEIGKRCYFTFILTAFSAACAHDEARGDLFDPKYRVPALELPTPALPTSDAALLH